MSMYMHARIHVHSNTMQWFNALPWCILAMGNFLSNSTLIEKTLHNIQLSTINIDFKHYSDAYTVLFITHPMLQGILRPIINGSQNSVVKTILVML